MLPLFADVIFNPVAELAIVLTPILLALLCAAAVITAILLVVLRLRAKRK